MDVNPNRDDQDCVNTEVENGMNQYGDAAGVHVAKLHDPRPGRYLEEQPRGEEDEHHHCHRHWSPVSAAHGS